MMQFLQMFLMILVYVSGAKGTYFLVFDLLYKRVETEKEFALELAIFWPVTIPFLGMCWVTTKTEKWAKMKHWWNKDWADNNKKEEQRK